MKNWTEPVKVKRRRQRKQITETPKESKRFTSKPSRKAQMANVSASNSSNAVKSASPIHILHQIHTNLDQENFLLWRSQIIPVLRGHGLMGYLDGSATPPARTIVDGDGAIVPNPEFQQWQQQDQLILAWIFSSLSQSMLAQVVNCQSAAELWITITQIYGSHSMAKELDLKLQLQTLKKGGSTVSQYTQQMQNIADRLRSIGSGVSDQDLVAYTIQGLGSDYDAFVTAITMRDRSPTMPELCNLLFAQEARILTNLRANSTSAVHLTQETASGHKALYTNGNKGKTTTQSGQNTQPQYVNSGRGRSNYQRGRGTQRGRGRGRQQNSSQQDVVCQICDKWGHGALECYHRFDIRYTGATPSSQSQNHQALVAEPAASSNSAWYIDSGATTHVTSDINNLSSSQSYNGPDAVHIGNGSGLSIAHIGFAQIDTGFRPIKLTNVLHVPEITKNLISVSQLALDNDVIIEFSPSHCFVKDQATHKMLLHGILINGLYQLVQSPSQHQVLQVHQQQLDLWHYRLGHCNFQILDKLKKAKLINSGASKCNSECYGCNKAKAHKLPFVPSVNKATKPLEVIHSDLWGPAPVLSTNGCRYYVLFTDEFSRFTWLYPCTNKSDVSDIFAKFRSRVENLLSSKIKIFQCDNGTEFKPLMKQHPDITFQTSCPYTPEQNGLAERKHRHVVELSLATMFQADIPLQFWDYVFESITFIINRLPSTATGLITPFETLFSQKPDYKMLHVIGCVCFPLLRPYNKHKLETRSEMCAFLGYSSTQKGYYCLHIPSGKVYVSRHVKFDEHTMAFKMETLKPPTTQLPSQSQNILTILPETHHQLEPHPHAPNNIPPPPDIPPPDIPPPVTPSPVHTMSNTSPQPPPTITSTQNAPAHSMMTRSKTNKLKPKTFPHHQVYSSDQHTTDVSEPTSYTQASKFKCWREAMANELTALAKNATWELVQCPTNAHVIGAKWLYRIKYRADGSVERYKARLVAKGYTQQEGIDYWETFSPVVKPTTIRVVLTIALSKNWPIKQLDVNNAFLHGDLEETVYMQQPPGFVDPHYPQHVCKLKKALYGLKQAPRAWFHKLKRFLLDHSFTCAQSDHSLFIFQTNDIIIYLLVYVDDIVITGNSEHTIQKLMTLLDNTFSIKNLGTLNYFLGIEVQHQPHSLHLSQTRYLKSILQRASMTGAKPCQTPMQSGVQISKFSGTPMEDAQLYRSIVGALQYATITRPDLTFAVNKAAQFMAVPTDNH
ncbi:hypothetical protein LUZ61_005109 [Rhynchospora tenuis]|uniref:Integrase catalytic domain-containing protein n=1 Tax=Rhynchospora tenuis TaxID=198213 RepID=A0AAD5ZNZ1_9POAL|nr:hypothetical protein LUZ61_005109 [Rhynchospora tenuis]